ncbi:MAG: glycine oxidase ThiO [Acidobacteriota bacterium]|nr:glycine oxidase ThiO [Acidobacteriota bacterium]MDH3529539.1 glycine oxidase ThiO [Acidobacteriota bacterium]
MRVLVIGGGIAGLTIAREFLRRGVTGVSVFEKGALGSEASSAAAGMLAPQAESDADDAFFRFCCVARDFYVGFAEEIENESGIGVELDLEGTLYAAFGESDLRELRQRYEWQRAAGLPIERLTAVETLELEPLISSDVTGSLFFPNDWQVENRQLMKALSKSLRLYNATIYEDTPVRALVFERNSVRGVRTRNGELHEADLIVIATGAWTSLIEADRAGFAIPAVKPVRGQMISYCTPKRNLRRVIYSHRGYLVPRSDGRILAGATVEDTGFEKGVTAEGVSSLKKNAGEIVPQLREMESSEQWSGLRPFASDGLPLIGDVPGCEALYISTGHYRNGILLAPLTAGLIVESILGGERSEYLDCFGPNRASSSAAKA